MLNNTLFTVSAVSVVILLVVAVFFVVVFRVMEMDDAPLRDERHPSYGNVHSINFGGHAQRVTAGERLLQHYQKQHGCLVVRTASYTAVDVRVVHYDVHHISKEESEDLTKLLKWALRIS